MILRFIAAAVLASMVCLVCPAQIPSNRITSKNDIRLFAVAAAVDVARLGQGSRFGRDLDPDLIRRLQLFYSAHKGGRSDDNQYGQYFGLAIVLSDPPELKARYREEQLPDETRAILGFPALLQEFYVKARVLQRWVEIQPQYDTEIKNLQPKITEIMLQTDAYLRNSISGSGRQVLHIESELAAPANSVNIRVFQSDYYVVLGPLTGSGSSSGMESFRHAYLHFHLDELIGRNLSRFESREKYLGLVSGEAGLDPVYTREFGLMAVESLIRAVELRMDRVTAVRAKDVVANAYRLGLLLTPYFYDALQNFQSNTTTIREFFPEIASGVSYATERSRFQSTFHTIPLPKPSDRAAEVLESVAAAPTPPDPVRELIVEAQTAYNSMDNDGARALFEKVLREHDPGNGAALYGLALLASRDADVEQSQIYFERTIKSSSADRSMKVWSYIYLGRIADLQCQRDRATEYYRQAIQIGDNSRDAQTVATGGLSKSFGDQCR